MKRNNPKRNLAEAFATNSGINPLLQQLLALERYPAMRFMVFGEQFIYMFKDSFVYDDELDEVSPKNMSDHDIISWLHANSGYIYEALQHIYPRDEQKFKEIIELIFNTIALYLSENIYSPGKTMAESQESMQHRIALMESVFGEKFSEKVQPMKNVFRLQHERSLEDPVQDAKDSDEDIKKVNTNGIQGEESVYMSPMEVADYFSVTKKTIWVWEKKGAIPKGIMVGGKKLFKRDELMAFVKKSNGLKE